MSGASFYRRLNSVSVTNRLLSPGLDFCRPKLLSVTHQRRGICFCLTDSYVVRSCVLCPLCFLCVSKNVGNNIKREENMKTKNLTKIFNQNPAQIYFAI